MSGPVATTDVDGDPAAAEAATVEVTPSREGTVGDLPVRRALPRRHRRTVGAWCFVDHLGPADVDPERGIGVAPHPHIGLQTVTWLFEGEVLHRDSLGTEQPIRPGQLNLMTAGRGVAHSEEGTGRGPGRVHGVQLWVAQPEATRHGPPAFEHHPELPEVDLGSGCRATVLVGELAGATSPARRDTDHLGAHLVLPTGRATVPVRPEHEHALVVFEGAVDVGGTAVGPGHLAYLGMGRDELDLATVEAGHALLLGGVPFGEQVLMWWNYVARTRDEVLDAHDAWRRRDDRFGSVASTLPPIDVDPPPWRRAGS